MKNIFVCLFIISLSFGCTKKSEKIQLKYTAEEFMKLAEETTLSKEKEDSIQFTDYADGVNRVDSKALIYNRLSFFVIEFATEDQARAEALRLNQYYSRNWLFDRVDGEPVLEDYVIETFKAINPKRRVQRVPKKHEAKKEGEDESGSEKPAHEALSHEAPAHH